MKRSGMRRLSVVALGVLLSAAWSSAQQPAAPAAATPRIAVVDIERLVAETALGKQYAERVKAVQEELRVEGEKRQAALARLDERLQQQQELLAKDQATLSPEAREQRQQAASKLSRERESYRQDSQDVLGALQRKLSREQQRMEGELHEKLAAVVQRMSTEKGLDLLLDRRACLVVGPAVDLTEEAMRRVDAQAGTATAPAAQPAAKAPAAAPKR